MTVSDSPKQLNGYMLDTTEFNAVMKGELPISAVSGQRLFATHIQLDQLNRTPCGETRAKLRAAFKDVAPKNLATESFAIGISRIGDAKLSAEDSDFKSMLARLKALDRAGKNRHMNQCCDILIAETAIRNGLTLVSGDANLRKVTNEFGGRAIDREQFMRMTVHKSAVEP
jgi:predicted nucleic acid-binding protein